MAHLFIIAGHGAGDCGAIGYGYTEAERVRALASRLQALGGGNVTVADMNRNWYADNGIMSLNIPKDWQILELHMDSAGASAKGGHVIINSAYSADQYDTALASFIGSFFPGRAKNIVPRSDLANPNRAAARGYSYRLLENGFITNSGDLNKFNCKMDDLARGILNAFGIATASPAKEDSDGKVTSGGTSQDSVQHYGKRISRSLKNESLSGLVPIYDHSLVILADEDEEVQADIAICKSNSGISGSRLAAAHVRLGEKIGRHIATVFPEKNTSILVLERGGRFFGDGVYMGAGGIFYSMNPKQDDAPVINTERVVIVDSVINTGKSIMRIIDELKNHNPGIDVIIAANVIQNEAVELFKDYLVFATRLSKNSFVGVNQSKQTGKTGPDTADRLFNLIKKRY